MSNHISASISDRWADPLVETDEGYLWEGHVVVAACPFVVVSAFTAAVVGVCVTANIG
ncbi:hypothetical protein AAH978_00610 [Streptomyces sp. ZYX-F-203]